MKRKGYKLEYDRTIDAAYLTLASKRVASSEEVKPGLIVDFDKDDNIVGVEILRFAARFQRQRSSKKTSRADRAA